MLPLLIKFPSRARPRVFKTTLDLWNAQPDAVRFIISLDSDDLAIPEYLRLIGEMPNAEIFIGKSANKVDAINRDMEHAGDWQIGILASDDMIPQRPDYAARIADLMAQHFPDGDGVLHLNDGRAGRSLNTLCCCGKRYFDRFGYWYHPEFQSLWCDNQWQEVSERLGRAVYVDEVLIAHKWTDVTGQDELHRRNEQAYQADADTFERHRLAGFPV